MESGVPNAEYEGDQAEEVRGAILHPLASMTIEPQEWLNQLQLGRPPSYTIEAGGFQSAYLDESVYISVSDNTPASHYCSNVLHVSRIEKQSYCKLATPTEGYALAVYQSKIVLIGGDKPSSLYQGRSNDDPKKYRMISVLDDDCGLEEKLKSALDSVRKKSRYVYEIGRNACAVGEGDLLIVIGGDGPHNSAGDRQLKSDSHDYVRVFNGKKWSHGLIDVMTGYYDGHTFWHQQKTLLVFQDHLYMSAFDYDSSKTKFYYTSIECLKMQLDPKAPVSWSQLEDIPDDPRCTNLSVLGNQLVTIGVVEGGGFRMYAYMARSSMWIAVHEFQEADMIQKSALSITGIIGLQSFSSPSNQVEVLLVVGATNYLTKTLKLSMKSQPYNPESKVTFLALSKLEGLANIPVLTDIENNAEKFMDKAGFQFVYRFRSKKVRLAYEYIESWQIEKNPFYKPTWSGLIAVLETIGLESLAKRIDSILKKTSPPDVEHLDEHKVPKNVMELLMKLKGGLAQLNKKEPKRLQKKILNSCTRKCDRVLKKYRIEKTELEGELGSKNAYIDDLTKQLNFYRQIIRSGEDPGVHLQHPSPSTSGDDKSEPPDLGDLIGILYPVASKWEILGLVLRVESSELEKIEKENQKDCSKCLLEMLKWWLRNIPNCSWSSVAEALKKIEYKTLAEEVLKTHCRSRLNTQN